MNASKHGHMKGHMHGHEHASMHACMLVGMSVPVCTNVPRYSWAHVCKHVCVCKYVRA